MIHHQQLEKEKWMSVDSHYYVHDIPGRLRVKIPMIKHHPFVARQVRSLFEHLKGIESISMNSLTGSVIFYYDPALILNEQILNILKENNLFDDTRAITNDHYIQNMVSKGGEAVGKVFFCWVLEKALEEV